MMTPKQKQAWNLFLKTLGTKGSTLNWKELLGEAGFSEAVQHTPSKVYDSKAWREKLSSICNDEEELERLKKIIKEGDDRNAIKAIRLSWKAKGRLEEVVRHGSLEETKDIFVTEEEYEKENRKEKKDSVRKEDSGEDRVDTT